MKVKDLINKLKECNEESTCRVYLDGDLFDIDMIDDSFTDLRVDININSLE